MRKIFLDCGSNLGQGFEKIFQENDMNDDWEFFLFEPNKECCEILRENIKFTKLEINQKAVSDKYKTTNLILEYCPTKLGWVGGATRINYDNYIKPEYISDEHLKKSSYEVDTIDLSDFIKKNFSKEDFIILKLDVEGSEFDVLQKMISDETLEYIKKIYVEWHERFFHGNKLNEKTFIINKITEKNINYNIWY